MAASRTALFDLDGTLIDSEADIAAALNHTLAEHGRQPLSLEQVRGMVGDGLGKLTERGFAATGAPLAGAALAAAERQCVAQYRLVPCRHTVALPRVKETLQLLGQRGWLCAVCTNKHEDIARRILETLGLLRFLRTVTGSDTFGVRKPDPRQLLATLQNLDAEPEQAVMVGDSGNDVQSARAAGLPVIVVESPLCAQPGVTLGADRLIPGFAELPAALEQLRPERGIS